MAATASLPITRHLEIEALQEAVRWPSASPRTAVVLAGQFLASRWQSARTGHSPVPAGRLPGVARISLAPPGGSPALPPPPSMSAPRAGGHPVPFRTLTLKFTGLTGSTNRSLALKVTRLLRF